MQGASGAHVTINGSNATKSAADDTVRERLRAQYDWLRDHHTAPVVQVHGWSRTRDGYDMEILYDWGQPYAPARLIAPAEKLWSRPAEVELDVDAHSDWVAEKLNQGDEYDGFARVSETAFDLRRYVMGRAQYLTPRLTHGDLTRVNTMQRHRVHVSRIQGVTFPGVESVLIDPIPATPACADIWAFDVSKLFVSLLGYEHVAYGWPPPDTCDRLWITSIMMRMNPVEIECVRYMAVVQIARMLPYHPKEMHDGLIAIANQAVRLRP